MYPSVVAAVVFCCVLLSEAQVGVPGGFRSEDVNDPSVKALAEKALQRINAASNDLFQQTIIKVINAKTQVVAGTNTELELLIAPTGCRKNQSSTDKCTVTQNGQKQICTVSIWEKPWENFEKITVKGCKAA
ncbi:unnamed protein product [Toxocara canis]|nr:unnamed protein product [Toxocara canis]